MSLAVIPQCSNIAIHNQDAGEAVAAELQADEGIDMATVGLCLGPTAC